MSKPDTVRERVLRRMPEELWLSPRMVARMIGSTAPAVERTLFDMSAAGEVLMRRQAMAEENRTEVLSVTHLGEDETVYDWRR